jgi:hypothetical protein
VCQLAQALVKLCCDVCREFADWRHGGGVGLVVQMRASAGPLSLQARPCDCPLAGCHTWIITIFWLPVSRVASRELFGRCTRGRLTYSGTNPPTPATRMARVPIEAAGVRPRPIWVITKDDLVPSSADIKKQVIAGAR